MLAYYELTKKSWFDPNNKTITACHTSIANAYKGLIVTPGHEKACFRLLDEAQKATEHPHVRTLIQRMRAQFAGFSKQLARLVVARIPEIGGDKGDFDSLQWEKPMPSDDFKLTTRTTGAAETPQRTEIKAAHDGRSLYLKFTASGRPPTASGTAASAGNREVWPSGDRMEFWLFQGRESRVFAFNARGDHYDARNLDRSWDSGWKLQTRQTKTGWEAVVTLPLAALKLTPGKTTAWRWFCTRRVAGTTPISYQGHPLYYRDFPVIIE